MKINEQKIAELISQGEGISLEFKTCRNQINRDVYETYASGVPARLVIEYGTVTTYNANRPHGFGILNPKTFAPYPKNPVIGAFFRKIDRADELGSGMRKMMLYGKQYGGADPQLIEGDVFRMIVKVPEFSQNPATSPESPQVTPQVLTVLYEADTAQAANKLQQAVGLKDRVHFLKAYLEPLLAAELIERTIPDKPRSSKQKYRLTQKGKEMLKNNRGDR